MEAFHDTHAHLDFPDFAADLPEVIGRAREAGVERILTIGTTIAGSLRAIAIAERYPEVYAAVGVHPGHVDESPDDVVPALGAMLDHPKVVAIGETGLDFFRRPGEAGPDPAAAARNRAKQESLFRQQLGLAAARGLNVIVHTRDSFAATLESFAPFAGMVRGVFHCWVGTPTELAGVVALGSMASFTGIATFRNGANVREAAAAAPAGSFMLETDCPFLAPVPHRGRRCEPAHVVETARAVAAARGCTPEELSAMTGAAAREFFPRMFRA
jgi:TatD DNase family protein